jgi:hypothetical protein
MFHNRRIAADRLHHRRNPKTQKIAARLDAWRKINSCARNSRIGAKTKSENVKIVEQRRHLF